MCKQDFENEKGRKKEVNNLEVYLYNQSSLTWNVVLLTQCNCS